MPTVSVIIPNFNREHLIGETLRCLLNQTRPADEIIVVDDGSTDRSVEVLKTFGDRITLITQPNSGPAAARNRGLAAASGDLIQFFDSDDLLSLNKLEVQTRALEQTGADFAYGPWLQVELENGKATYSDAVIQRGPLPPHRSALSWFLNDWVIVFQCCLVRRDLLDRVGPYRTDLMLAEDCELLFRMLKAGAKGVHTPDCLVLYRSHGANQLSQGGAQNAKRTDDLLSYVLGVADQLDGPGEPVNWADRISWDVTVADVQRRALAQPQEDCADFRQATAFPPAKQLMLRAMDRLRRLNKGLDRRLRGSKFGPAYSPGALTKNQKDMILALGYEPSPASVRYSATRAI